jgi:hypothetical protein
MTPEIPRALLDEHPELVQVATALAAYRAGKPVTTPCHVCGKALIVEVFSEVGILVVTCPCGHMHYRTRWTPTATPPASARQEQTKSSAIPKGSM